MSSYGYRFTIFKDVAGGYRVRFSYRGTKIFVTESYETKQSARKAIRGIKLNGLLAKVEDHS